MEKLQLQISGMHCSGCENFISKTLSADGIMKTIVDRKTGIADVVFDERKITKELIVDLINASESYKVAGATLMK